MKTIDLNSWSRKDAFILFSNTDYPFYSVTIPVEVTNIKKYSKLHNLSFYYSLIWACTKAINEVQAFRVRIRKSEIIEHEQTNPSFTTIRKGSENFYIVNAEWKQDIKDFCIEADTNAKEQTNFINMEEETDALIYFSCTPWFDFSALTNEHNFDKDDTVPRIAWGKYYEENDKLFVHMSVEVNHRTIDGFHLGQFKEKLDLIINNLQNYKDC